MPHLPFIKKVKTDSIAISLQAIEVNGEIGYVLSDSKNFFYDPETAKEIMRGLSLAYENETLKEKMKQRNQETKALYAGMDIEENGRYVIGRRNPVPAFVEKIHDSTHTWTCSNCKGDIKPHQTYYRLNTLYVPHGLFSETSYDIYTCSESCIKTLWDAELDQFLASGVPEDYS